MDTENAVLDPLTAINPISEQVIFANDIVGSDETDIIIGTEQNERIFGLGGDDFIQGGMGNNAIDGGDGNDIIFANSIYNFVGTENFNNTIYGGNGNDVLFGGAGNDYLDGGDGDDFLSGGWGNDSLIGGVGKDTFYFQAPLAFNNNLGVVNTLSNFSVALGVDTITDFTPGEDTILLSQKLFSNLSQVVDFSTVFATVNSDLAVETNNALIVYNSVNGNLFYNQNGSELGFGDGGLFAVLSGVPAITALDFAVTKMTS